MKTLEIGERGMATATTMYVHESGSPGSPAVVFLHGAGRERADVARPHGPAHGDSTAWPRTCPDSVAATTCRRSRSTRPQTWSRS